MFIERKYLMLASARFSGFKQIDKNLWVCRCPFCGDSKRNKRKKRGYFFPSEDRQSIIFYCHNCSESHSLYNILKNNDEALWKQYMFERIKDKRHNKSSDEEQTIDEGFVSTVPQFASSDNILDSEFLHSIEPESKEWNYLVIERKINPAHVGKYFRYCSKFKEFVNSVVPGKFDEDSLKKDGPRIIILFFDEDGKNVHTIQGRALPWQNQYVKYITIRIDENYPKVFGLDRPIDIHRPLYVVEGPIDSLFLQNCIAVAGSDLLSLYNKLIMKKGGLPAPVFIYDNEPRSIEIVKKMEKVIDIGHGILIWPIHIKQKDINDAVKDGIVMESVLEKCVCNTLEAKLKFNRWRKV